MEVDAVELSSPSASPVATDGASKVKVKLNVRAKNEGGQSRARPRPPRKPKAPDSVRHEGTAKVGTAEVASAQDGAGNEVFGKAKPRKRKQGPSEVVAVDFHAEDNKLHPKQAARMKKSAGPGAARPKSKSKKVDAAVKRERDRGSDTESELELRSDPDTETDADVLTVDGAKYRKVERDLRLLEEQSEGISRELEKTEERVRQLKREKLSLLDELIVLEKLAVNPYPPFRSKEAGDSR